jgi:hypothetical protein
MVCGALSLCLVFPALISLLLALSVGVMVKKDATQMEAGMMDPDGKEQMAMASIRATYGTILSLICWIPAIIIWDLILIFYRY